MPEIKTYVVSQTREVRVVATSLLSAATVASRAFENTPVHVVDAVGHVTSEIVATDLAVRESY